MVPLPGALEYVVTSSSASFRSTACLAAFSSDELAYYGGIFVPEVMLRTLQFGIPGTLALAMIVLNAAPPRHDH